MSDALKTCPDDLAAWPQERLEHEICQHAVNIAAAEAQFLKLIAEFDRRIGWADWGCRSCAQWLSWHCGMAIVTGREHVRIARRLEEFPATMAEFASGRLSYSKVRAMTRVLTPENEPVILEYARYATASQLERILRGFRAVREQEDEDEEDLEERRARQRTFGFYWDDDGMLVWFGKAPPEEGAVILQALFRKAAVLDPPRRRRPDDDSAESPSEPDPPEEPEPSVPAVDDSAESLFEPTDDIPPTPPITFLDEDGEEITIGGPAWTGDASDAEAEDDVDPEAGSADDSAEAPPRSGGGKRWADAFVALCESALEMDPGLGLGGFRAEVMVMMDLDTLLRGTPDSLNRPLARLDDGPELPQEIVEMLMCDCSLRPLIRDGKTGETLDIGRRSKYPTKAQRKALQIRDGGCTIQGCDQHAWVDAHHLKQWTKGGPTSIRNLGLLCRFHHRLVHRKGWTLRLLADGKFELRRPDGTVIAGLPVDAPTDIAWENFRRGVDAPIDGLAAEFGPRSFDLGMAVESILEADRKDNSALLS